VWTRPGAQMEQLRPANPLGRSPLHTLVSDQGPFAPPALPGLLTTTALSATPPGPVPSLARHRLAGHTPQPPRGASRVTPIPLYMHAVALTPAEPSGARVVRFPNGGGLPQNAAGSAPASPFSRPAQRSLHVMACMLARSLKDPLHWKLRLLRYLHNRSNCYRPERQLPGGSRTH
jgi:hypothetical protein